LRRHIVAKSAVTYLWHACLRSITAAFGKFPFSVLRRICLVILSSAATLSILPDACSAKHCSLYRTMAAIRFFQLGKQPSRTKQLQGSSPRHEAPPEDHEPHYRGGLGAKHSGSMLDEHKIPTSPWTPMQLSFHANAAPDFLFIMAMRPT
jgi:hypothetical protein